MPKFIRPALICSVLLGAIWFGGQWGIFAQSTNGATAAATAPAAGQAADSEAVTFNEIDLDQYNWIDQAYRPGAGYTTFEERRNYQEAQERQRIYEERRKRDLENVDLIDANWRKAMMGSALAARNAASSGGAETVTIPQSEMPPRGLYIPAGAFTGSNEQETAYLPNITAGMDQAPYLSRKIGRENQATERDPAEAPGEKLPFEVRKKQPKEDDPNAPHKTMPPVPSMF